MLTKTGIKILKIFCGNINKKFTIKGIAQQLSKKYPLIHRTIQQLIKKTYLSKDEYGLISLNYKKNHSELGYIEAIRAKEFLGKHKTIKLFYQDLLEKININYFTFLIFGSYVKGKQTKRSDVDVLIIIEEQEKINKIEKLVNNIASNFSLNFDCQVISSESVYEMAIKREEKNVFNETLNHHIILFGAENYYYMLKNAR